MRENKPNRIFIHTTDADFNKINPQFFAVNKWHKDRFGDYCHSSLGYYGGYHVLIEKDGTEFRYREDNEESCAAKGHNTTALHVALAFDGDIQIPTSAQIKTLKKRINKWANLYQIDTSRVDRVSPHRLVAPHKTCYGSLLADDWAVNLLRDQTPKDNSQVANKIKIEEQKRLMDKLAKLMLQLKILLGQYIKILNKRSQK